MAVQFVFKRLGDDDTGPSNDGRAVAFAGSISDVRGATPNTGKPSKVFIESFHPSDDIYTKSTLPRVTLWSMRFVLLLLLLSGQIG